MSSPVALPDLDPRAFRDALGCFPTGVAVITTVHDEVPVGLTCNSFSSVSLDPPLVLWSLRSGSKSLAAFRAARTFAINILGAEQNETSARFASSKVVDKFEGIAWRTGLNGVPVLAGCVASFECSTYAEHEAGDHVIFIGRVSRFEHALREDPLVFFRGAYMMVTRSLREMTVRGEIVRADLDEARWVLYRSLLPLACANATESDFDAMESLLDEMTGLLAMDQMAQRSELAVRFLQHISFAAHNGVLSIVTESLSSLLRHAASVNPPRNVAQSLVPLRLRILEALKNRDSMAAVEAMESYVKELRTLQP